MELHRPSGYKRQKNKKVRQSPTSPTQAEAEAEAEAEDGSLNSFGKSENLFFGDVPHDLIQLAACLQPSSKNAAEWQQYVASEIQNLGYNVIKEVNCPIDEERNGRLDLLAEKNGIQVAIEVDYRTPRKKSIKKVKQYQVGIVLLRKPEIIIKAPERKTSPQFTLEQQLYPMRDPNNLDGWFLENRAFKRLFQELKIER